MIDIFYCIIRYTTRMDISEYIHRLKGRPSLLGSKRKEKVGYGIKKLDIIVGRILPIDGYELKDVSSRDHLLLRTAMEKNIQLQILRILLLSVEKGKQQRAPRLPRLLISEPPPPSHPFQKILSLSSIMKMSLILKCQT